MDKWTIVGYGVGILFNIGFVAALRAKLYDSSVEFLKSGRLAWMLVFLLSFVEMAIAGKMEVLQKADTFMEILQAAAAYATATQAAYAGGKPVWNAAVKSGSVLKCLILAIICLVITAPAGAQVNFAPTIATTTIGMTQVSVMSPAVAQVDAIGIAQASIAAAPVMQINDPISSITEFIDKFGGKLIYLQSFKTHESCAAADISYKLWEPTKQITVNADLIGKFDDGLQCGFGASVDLNNLSSVLKVGIGWVPDYELSWYFQLVKWFGD
jgi:hypothetical protein